MTAYEVARPRPEAAVKGGATDKRRDPRDRLRGLDFEQQTAMLAPDGPVQMERSAAPPTEAPAQAHDDADDGALGAELAAQIDASKASATKAEADLAALEAERSDVPYGEYVVRRLRLEKARDTARDELGAARRDLQTLEDPAAKPEDVAAVRGRHDPAYRASNTTEAASGKLEAARYTREWSTATVDQEGADKKTSTSSSSASVDLLNRSAKYGTKSGEVTEKDGKKQGTTEERSVSVSGDGVATDYKQTTQDGDKKNWVSGSASVDRGAGKLGGSLGGGAGFGSADDDWKQSGSVKGKVKSGVIHGDDGDGTYSGVEGSAGVAGANVSVNASTDGRVKVEVTPIPGSDPPAFKVVTRVVVGESEGVGAGFAPGKDLKIGGSVSASSTSKQETVQTRQLTEAEKNAYLAELERAKQGAPSQYPELNAVSVGYTRGWEAARGEASAAAEDGFDASSATAMKDGEAFELNLDESESVGGKGSVELGGAGVGGGYTSTEGATRKIKVEKKGDTIVMTLDMMDKEGGKTDYSAKSGVAGLDFSEGEATRTGRSVTIAIDPKLPNYAELVAELRACTSRESLDAFVQRHPEVVTRQVTTTGSSTSSGANASVSDKKVFGTTESADRQEQEITGKDGKKSYELSGKNERGGHLLETYKGSTTEQLDVSVGDNGEATGDLSETRETTDASGSAKKWAANAAKDPLAAVTGGASADAKEVEVAGILLGPEDFSRIMGQANADPTGQSWSAAGGVSRPAHVRDWERCRRAIVAAGDDKVAVARALRDFIGTEKGGRYDVLYNLVRQPHSGTGGNAYELPDGLASYRSAYRAVVQGDPAGPVRDLVAAEKWGEAGKKARALLDQLDTLANVIGAHDFDEPAVRVEMLAMINQRKQELESLHRRIDAGESGLELSDEEVEAGDAWTAYLADFATCEQAKRDEGALFAQIAALAPTESEIPQRKAQEATALVNKLRDLNVQHKRAYGLLCGRAEAHPDFAEQKPYRHLAPDSVKVKFAFDEQASQRQGQASYGNPLSPEAERAQDEADQSAELRDADNKDMRENSLEAQQKKAAADAWKKQQANQAAAEGAVADYDRQVAQLRSAAQRAAGKCNSCNLQGIPIKPAASPKYSAGYAKYTEACQHDGYARSGLGQYVSAESAAGAVGRMVAEASALFNQAIALFKEGDALQG